MIASHSVTAFAKTTQPSLGSVVAREALFARLDAPPGRAVVWIVGPPGAGKTTLAASYVEARRLHAVWYQLDADDADPATFFHYLAHAAAKRAKEGATALPGFAPRHGDDVAPFARQYFRRLYASLPRPFVLVLDNLQVVPAESDLYLAVEAALGEVPQQGLVIVTSRRDPPPALARLRATGTMSCVTGADLAFGPDDVAAIAVARGQSLSPEAAARLFERTQGWAAGLVLMLEHARFAGRIAELPGDAAPQVVFDYLAGEIFDRFDRSTRDFLLRVACLPRATAAVAEALSGEANAARLLVNLALNDYFVRESQGEGGRIYQMHPLMREFLRHRAAEALPEAVAATWLVRAARLLHQAGQTEDAIGLLIEARDWDEVARIVVAETDVLLAQGRSETLVGWLDVLPPAMQEADPRLLCAAAAARKHARPRSARQRYEQAFVRYRGGEDRAGMIECSRGVIDCIVLEFDDLAALDPWIDTLALLLAPQGVVPEGVDSAAVMTLVRAMLLRGTEGARLGDWRDAMMVRGSRAHVDDGSHIERSLVLAWAALLYGDATAATALLDDPEVAGSGAAPRHAQASALVRSASHLIVGAHAEARRVASDALAVAAEAGVRASALWLPLVVAVACLCRNDTAGAASALASSQAATTPRRGERACTHYVRGWLAACTGDPITAHREARLALALASETGLPWFESLARLALTELAAASGDSHAAETHLRSLQALGERFASPWLRCTVDVATAVVARAAHDEVAALAGIESAFRSARQNGVGPLATWRPQALAELCAIALTHGVEAEWTRSLVRARQLAAPPASWRSPAWPWPFCIRTFSGFGLWRGDVPVEFVGKGPGRPLELLKVLVARGSHQVRVDQLADALWPNAEADYAHKSFTATLHRLRRMMGEEDTLVMSDGRLSLNRSLVWVDAVALEHLLDSFDDKVARNGARGVEVATRGFVDEMLTLYRGPFLPDESEQPSFITCREQFRARMLRALTSMSRNLEANGAHRIAADFYWRCIEADDLWEPWYRDLMLCLQRNGSPSDAIAVYERLRATLSARQKLMPSKEIQALYASLNGAPVVPAKPASL